MNNHADYIKSLSPKQKIKKAIPGIIAMGFFIWLFSWGISGQKKCDKALENNGEVILMFVEKSRVGRLGNGSRTIFTTFSTIHDGEKITAEYKGFNDVVPENLPAYVIYTFDCKDCYKFLLDSVVIYKGYKIEYPYIKNTGREYKIEKINDNTKTTTNANIL